MRCDVFLVFLGILTIASALSDSEEWINFKKNHGKAYKHSVEENYRFSVFQGNLRKIEEHNEKFKQGQYSYEMGMNMFGDLTFAEFRDKHLKPPSKINRPRTSPESERVQYTGHVPGRKDWREKGAVTKPRNEGQCSGSWAFTAASAVEGAHFIQSGKLVSMSEQVLIDCVKNKCDGCNKCEEIQAWEYLKTNGIVTEAAYPYKGTNQACQLNGTEPVLKIKKYSFIIKEDEEDLRQAVATQPVAASIYVLDGFQFYQSGIFWDNLCVYDLVLNHNILVIGYDLDHGSDIDYWIAKNSWGTGWGMDGYVNIRRNTNECGIANYALYPVL